MYLIVGLLLGAVSSFSYAQAGWVGNSGIFSRGGDGKLTGVNMPSSGSNTFGDLLNRDYISVSEKGDWQGLDKNGNGVKIPGEQKVKIPGGALSKAAGAAAFAAKGTIGGIILGALASEAVTLAQDQWTKKQRIDNEYKYDCMNAQCRGIDGPEAACEFETDRQRQLAIMGGNGHYTFTSLSPIPASNGVDYTCRAWVVRPQISAGEQSTGGVVGMKQAPYDKQVPATQADLEAALDARRQKIDGALKDYYDAIDKQKADELAKTDGQYDATGQLTATPKTTTTTNPDGSTSTKTVGNTYNVINNGNTYNTSTVTINQNTTTTTTTGGQTTTTTEGSTGNPLAPGEEDPPPTDCDKKPNSIGCSEFGEVGDTELERKELSGTVVPEQVGGAGQCPAPLAANVAGIHAEFSFDPLCQYANVIRPIALAFAWLAAGYILMGVVRGEG